MELSPEYILEFRSVGYTVNGLQVLKDLSLVITKGEVVVLLGESGCGKTTTLKLINALMTPTSGQLLVHGRSTVKWEPVELRRSIGYVIQDGGLFPHFTVSQNVGLVPTLRDFAPAQIAARINEMLSLVKLDPLKFAERFPHELSGGQRQRVGVARALAADPDLLLLDEPFGALDAITRSGLQREFAGMVHDMGKTAIFVTHDLHEAMLVGTRIALMEKGSIVLEQTPEGFRRSDLPLVRAFLDTVSILA
ncbi:MAG: ATP-binding cassette domain-containing protein [Pyrinomonadaceae bacterium]